MSVFSDLTRTGARSRLVACVGAVALLTAACGSDASGPEAREVEPVEASADAADGLSSVLTGEFTTLGGETLDLASLQGQDVVLWFWAPW